MKNNKNRAKALHEGLRICETHKGTKMTVKKFYKNTLPFMVGLVLDLPKWFHKITIPELIPGLHFKIHFEYLLRYFFL